MTTLPHPDDVAARKALAKRPQPPLDKVIEQIEAMRQPPIIVAYGGGTNSTAMLCGFRERDIRPALILFADTGGELPHTYEHLRVMSDKCQEWFGLPIETVFKTYQGGV
jgi:3'-phosphoadenosine 5'-phosphosulfate sulfotransferase (PAPS reductase)/FAD synthetase